MCATTAPIATAAFVSMVSGNIQSVGLPLLVLEVGGPLSLGLVAMAHRCPLPGRAGRQDRRGPYGDQSVEGRFHVAINQIDREHRDDGLLASLREQL